jgi:hypothetical protein
MHSSPQSPAQRITLVIWKLLVSPRDSKGRLRVLKNLQLDYTFELESWALVRPQFSSWQDIERLSCVSSFQTHSPSHQDSCCLFFTSFNRNESNIQKNTWIPLKFTHFSSSPTVTCDSQFENQVTLARGKSWFPCPQLAKSSKYSCTRAVCCNILYDSNGVCACAILLNNGLHRSWAKSFFPLYWTRSFITVLSRIHHWNLLWVWWIQSTI